MYYFTFFIFFFPSAFLRAFPDVIVHANVRQSIARQRCFLNTNEIYIYYRDVKKIISLSERYVSCDAVR